MKVDIMTSRIIAIEHHTYLFRLRNVGRMSR